MALGDALDDYGLEDDGFVGLVLAAAGDEGDFGDDVLAFDNFAEDGVVAGKPGSGANGDEELASVGAGTAVGHGELAGLVELVRRALGFVAEAVAWPAHAGAGGIAALDHEVGNDAVEDGSVEELVIGLDVGCGVGPLLGAFGEFDEVLDGDGGIGLEETDGDLAFGGGEDGVGSCCECHDYSWVKREDLEIRRSPCCEAKILSGAKAPNRFVLSFMYGLKPVPFMLKPVTFMLKPVPFMLKPVPFMLKPVPFMLKPVTFMLKPVPFMLKPVPFKDGKLPGSAYG